MEVNDEMIAKLDEEFGKLEEEPTKEGEPTTTEEQPESKPAATGEETPVENKVVSEENKPEEVPAETPPAEDEPEFEIPGLEKKLKASELIAGNMMRADYTRKTQELAEMRRELQRQIDEVKGLKPKPDANSTDGATSDEPEFDPNELKTLEKAIQRLGYVKKDDLEKEKERTKQLTEQQYFTEESQKFLKKYPELEKDLFAQQQIAEHIKKYNYKDRKLYPWALEKAKADYDEQLRAASLKSKGQSAAASVDAASSSSSATTPPPTNERRAYTQQEIEVAKKFGDWDEEKQMIIE